MTDWLNRCHFGDCLETLRQMPDGLVQTCVTSPPYFNLRDYGHAGQIGLEPTPDEFVAKLVTVFREVRRVLKDDGTLWLNIGDSYASNPASGGAQSSKMTGGEHKRTPSERKYQRPDGLKPKDLIGIPWMLARALRDPYYTGVVKDVCDQVWLAAMLDAEGSICGTEYQSGDRIKTNIYISITNTSVPVIEKCDRLFPQDLKHIYEKVNGTSNRKCFRWDVERMDQKAMFLRTIYPHLVAKRKQAIIGYTFIEMQRGLVSKKKGYLAEQHEQRSWLMQALSLLNSGQDVDIPDWCIEPPSLFEPGYYLRQDIIWSKPNPMPESVRDRCTKAHEYMFLLSKSERYFFDSDAIKEQSVTDDIRRPYGSKGAWDLDGRPEEQRPNGKPRGKGGKNAFRGQGHFRSADTGPANREGRDMADVGAGETRNRRSVWTVPTQPYKGAHFATFPPALIEPCILAGAPAGGIVLDPFFGSGTTGQVAQALGRQFIGLELNEAYKPLQDERLRQPSLLLEAA